MRRFELIEGTSSKFWEIEQTGRDLNIRWGRIGTAGQHQTKSFADHSKASAALDKLIHEKTRKGYAETRTDVGEHLCPGLEPDAQPVIDRQLATLSVETADPAELPEILRAPPWLSEAKKKPADVIELAPLPLEPVVQWEQTWHQWALNTRPARDRAGHVKIAEDVQSLLESLGFWADCQDPASQAFNAANAIARRDAEGFIRAWHDRYGDERRYTDNTAIPALPPEIAAPFWNAVADKIPLDYYKPDYTVAALGLSGLPGLLALVQENPVAFMYLAPNFGAVELAMPVARAFSKLKKARETARTWLLKYPEHAACGLIAPALGKAKDACAQAVAALRLLNAHGHGAVLMKAAGRYHNPAVVAALRAILDENPLDRFPAKRTALPEFWQPRHWQRPLLLNGKALPEAALEPLGQMLTFPTHEEIYAGITDVKAACEPDSLAAFAWDCFSAWMNAGAPSKDNWAMLALGTLGNDDTARKLTPMIRAWPGEAAHARAVTGLDVLEKIGTDVALLMLNGIAQKLKFKALQGSAREKINAIAEARNLTIEELEDRLAPDLGLDERGTLRLDFGPRSFMACFDEALKPYVRELGADGQPGNRLADLPKPKKTDDADLAKAATDRFKLLKKDARTIASQQLRRLEAAMCTRRRWTLDVFQQFLAGHPLLRHLVQRLIWAVYEVADGSNHGGEVRGFFRVAEDGTLTTAGDDPFEIPEGEGIRIGLPHALELPEADAAAFGQLFADYELLQPFTQMGRDVYTLTEDEKAARTLERWKGVIVPSGRVRGLVNRGWERGQVWDAGAFNDFYKPLGAGQSVKLNVTPGFVIGMEVDAVEAEQEICAITLDNGHTFGTLDAIAASELLRDLEALRA